MSQPLPAPTPALKVVRLLWTASRRRAAARNKRQSQIMGRTGRGTALATFFTIVGFCILQVLLGTIAGKFATSVIQSEIAAEGRVTTDGRVRLLDEEWSYLELAVVRRDEFNARRQAFAAVAKPKLSDRTPLTRARDSYARAVDSLLRRMYRVARTGTPTAEFDTRVRQLIAEKGQEGFVRAAGGSTLRSRIAQSDVAVLTVLGVMGFCWLAVLVCQGEGLELDMQKRRHPIWEWLVTHPVKPLHAFLSELLTPFMGNPAYATAPLFIWVVFGKTFGVGPGFLAALAIGLPAALVASLLYKAIETMALLRLSVRTRGALLGILSWLAYVGMIAPLIALRVDQFSPAFIARIRGLGEALPLRGVRFLFGGWSSEPSLLQAMTCWWILCLFLGSVGLWITYRATVSGMQPASPGGPPSGNRLLGRLLKTGSDPLRGKELMWLLRDRSAIIQVILIPLTIVTAQAYYYQALYDKLGHGWSTLAALTVVCGSYFLLVLGPRSLASEGTALWIPLTWPRGLEDLLRAKARLWRIVANTLVTIALLVIGFRFPGEWWKLGLVAVGWYLLGHALSLNAVSLVAVPSATGEPERRNQLKHGFSMLGPLTFCAGIVSESWSLAAIGLAYSTLIGVTMWQSLRTRLPYLFDPWSERPLPPPTLLQAAVAVACMTQLLAIAVVVLQAAAGPSAAWFVTAIGYGIVAAIGCAITQGVLSERGLRFRDVVRWNEPGQFRLRTGVPLGMLFGAGMAFLAAAYLKLVDLIPAAHDELLRLAARSQVDWAGQMHWIALVAIALAPAAEEYLFRGLLFRTLDRELGGWRALALSAALFAMFHPVISWAPVGCLGLLLAWLFRNTRSLLPCVVCHMTYNALVLYLGT